MRIVKILFFVFLIICFSGELCHGQVRRTNNFSSYKDDFNEIGYAFNVCYQKNERILAPNLHLHYSRVITNFFSLGAGYTGIYDIHSHNNLALELGVRFLPELLFVVKPGVTIKNFRNNLVVYYAFGLEGAYEFKIGDNAHVGPIVGLDYVQDDTVYWTGFHMGLTF